MLISYKRQIRLQDLEIFLIYKDSISLGYLIIEDLRRSLGEKELQLFPYRNMDQEDIQAYKNVIKIDVLSDEKLNDEEQEIFKEFAMDLVDCKDFCALVLNYHVNKELLEDLPLVNEPEDYQKILEEVGSEYNILKLDTKKMLYLSQD